MTYKKKYKYFMVSGVIQFKRVIRVIHYFTNKNLVLFFPFNKSILLDIYPRKKNNKKINKII